MLYSARVSNLELFRTWREAEDLEVEWLMARIREEEEPTPKMKAGTAFHAALETIDIEAELGTIAHGDYRFDFNCEAEIELTPFREKQIHKQYGDLLLRGTVDAVHGLKIVDYKTTEQFDADRYMEGYQWRYYLDMANCDTFTWKVFVIREFGPDNCYEIHQFHELTQRRYPDLTRDCERLAADYLEFAGLYLPDKAVLQAS